ncbi:MAG: hypothetical protein VXY56_12140, partial [Pseudomonadota bacterium]|nr:hypothetical protein [Pseudomonadota bacterium]
IFTTDIPPRVGTAAMAMAIFFWYAVALTLVIFINKKFQQKLQEKLQQTVRTSPHFKYYKIMNHRPLSKVPFIGSSGCQKSANQIARTKRNADAKETTARQNPSNFRKSCFRAVCKKGIISPLGKIWACFFF